MESTAMDARQDERQERLTDLQLLRLGAPGKPRQAAIAKKMKVSRPAVSQFEKGARESSVEFMRGYAKALGRSVKEVERRYWAARVAYCTESAREAREILRLLKPD